jgi:ATP-binding cassette subfamily C protein
LRDCRRAFGGVALFSGVVNLLMLAGPLYMLQIYDRVLSSRSVPTLVVLSIFLVGAYAFQGALDFIRSRVVVRSAALLDQHLALAVHSAAIRLAIANRHPSEGPQPVRDLDQIRAFLTGAGPIAIVDLPWIPVFLLICFLIHPWLGLAATVGGIVLFTMALLTERASRTPARTAAQDAGMRSIMVEATRRGGETIVAMGMSGSLAQRWARVNNRYIAAVAGLSDVAGFYGSTSKVLRLLLQSMILGLGAYLVIKQELTAGAMIAASIMMGRALAPIETTIANWRAFVAARQSIKRLSDTLARAAPKTDITALPPPARSLDVEQVAIAAPGTVTPIVTGVHFGLNRARRWATSVRAVPERLRWCVRWSAFGPRSRAVCGSMARCSASGIPGFSAATLDLSRRRSSCSTEPSPRTSREWPSPPTPKAYSAPPKLPALMT